MNDETYEVVIGGWITKELARAFANWISHGKYVPKGLTFTVQKSIKSDPQTNNPKGNN